MSGPFTRFGCLFFEWEPIRYLDTDALKTWMVIYTRCDIPGLWACDLPDIMSKTFFDPDRTLKSLDTLRDHELVEFDRRNRVLRLTEFPDAGEWPSSPNILNSWWSTFARKIPRCDVRDAHVETLRWLLDEGAKHVPRSKTKKPSAAHELIWSETFGTVTIPVRRSRGLRSLTDSDTATSSQPSLFGSDDAITVTSDPIQVDGIHRDPIRHSSVVLPSDIIEKTRSDDPITDPITDPTGEGDGVGDRVGEPALSGSASDPDPEITPRAKPALALVPTLDQHRERVGEIARLVGMRHVMAFARAKAALKSPAWGPGATDKHEELVALLSSMVSLDDAQAKCEYAIEIREAEAIRINSLKYFSGAMWKPENFKKAISHEVAEVNGTRANPVQALGPPDAFAIAAEVFREMRENAAKEKP